MATKKIPIGISIAPNATLSGLYGKDWIPKISSYAERPGENIPINTGRKKATTAMKWRNIVVVLRALSEVYFLRKIPRTIVLRKKNPHPIICIYIINILIYCEMLI